MMPLNKLLISSIPLFFLGFVVTAPTATISISYFLDKELFSSNETSTTNITTLPSTTDEMDITDNFNISALATQNSSFLDSVTTDLSHNSTKVSNVTQAKGFVTKPKPPPKGPIDTTTKTMDPMHLSRTSTKVSKVTQAKGFVTKPTPPPKGPFDTTTKTMGPMPSSSAVDHIVIIILGVIILVVFAAVAVCFFAQKRTRRYSVDLANRADEANIPLSAVEPELPAGTAPQNDLQNFEGAETSVKMPEPEPETQETQKTEDGEPAVDPSSDSAAPPPAAAPDRLEDEPKGDSVEQSPSVAFVMSNSEEKTDDDEGDVSNKTSVESLKETNENNNNNDDTNFGQRRDVQTSDELQEARANSPV